MTETTGATMRAMVLRSYDGPESLAEEQIERPTPGPGEVLVRVRTAGLNPSDWKHTRIPGHLNKLPSVLGWDVAGVVEETGPGVAIRTVGEEVVGSLPYPRGAGAFAEYVIAPARALVARPANLDWDQSAVLPLGSLTAWQALVDLANVQSGERVLVHAAAGGVGHLAVQIAKAKGAYVIGTASPGRHEELRALGVDQPFDYHTEKIADLEPVDVVLDTLGGDTAMESLKVLAPGGRIVSLTLFALPADWPEVVEREAPGRQQFRMLVESDQAGLAAVAALAADGKLKPRVQDTYPLNELAAAMDEGAKGRSFGKIVLRVS